MSARTLVVVGLLALAGGCGGRKDLLSSDNASLYRVAQSQVQRGKYIKARKTLGLMGIAEPIEPELDPQVKLATADAFFFQGGGLNIIEAQSRYQQFLNFYPTHPLAPYAQFQLGQCLLVQSEAPANDQEFTLRAIDEFRKVADLDPRSAYARAAVDRLRLAQDKLARKEWIVAAFYAKRKRWPAVVSRLQTLLRDYPGYAGRGEVFLMLGQALLETGSVTEGRIYLEKLRADEPGSELGERAGRLLLSAERGPTP